LFSPQNEHLGMWYLHNDETAAISQLCAAFPAWLIG